LTCETFLDRLYDDDARAAGRGLGDTPQDMTEHLLGCDRCRAAYHQADADDLLLTRALIDVPSPEWHAKALQQISRSPRMPWSQRIAAMNEAAIWGILAVAASQVLLGESSTSASIAAFSAGATAAVLRPNLSKHWLMLRHANS
jgi:hypothetical protein